MLEFVLVILASVIALALLGHIFVRSGRAFWKLRKRCTEALARALGSSGRVFGPIPWHEFVDA